MRYKITLLFFIFFLLSFGVKSQDVVVPLIFERGIDPNADSLWIQIQVWYDSLTTLREQTGWLYCPKDTFIYQASFPSTPVDTFYWRGRHKDENGSTSGWSELFHFILKVNLPPSGCKLISPKNGEIVKR